MKYTGVIRRLKSHQRGRGLGTSTMIVAVWIASTGPALAIPSPELVVGTLTSVSQLMALASALIGGGAVAAGSRMSRTRGAHGARGLQRVAVIAGLVALISLAANAYQFAGDRDERRNRLEASLIRPTPKSASGQSLDTALKEIAYKDQQSHPLGISTDEAEEIVRGVAAGTKPDWMILDIRETAETEMGTFKNAQKIRFPDLPHSVIDFTSRKALLICHNGNRSAETCAALAEKGINCRFIKGGLEKWLVEGRKLEGFTARTVDELRAIPDYPNHQTLLDTAEVRKLVTERGAVLVDVRYPGEFAAGHLPDAINLPLRPTPADEMQQRLAALPNAPIIAPCYDRRSCFFGEILGLELSRAGHDFRGRYTVPWEYFVSGPKPPHVEAWLAEANRSWWSKAADGLTAKLNDVAGRTGLPLALVLLAIVSRLLVLPFSLKAERDQIIARRIAPELAALKHTITDDPVRLTRAVRDLYRVNGLTPGRNLIALLFLPVLALSVEAAVRVAGLRPDPFLWLPDLARHDSLYVLPALFGGVLALYIDLAVTSTRRHRLICWLIVAPLLVAAGCLLPAAANLYVVISVFLLLLQRLIVAGSWRRLGAPFKRLKNAFYRVRLRHDDLVPLSAPMQRLNGAGNKATRLAEMAAMGLPVPRGVVLTGRFLSDYEASPPRRQRRHLARVWRLIGASRVAVRSSAAAEDGKKSSFAGVFESELNVARADMTTAVARVTASFNAGRAASYGLSGGDRNILVQPMIDAEWAGVVFTEDPQAPGAMLIEAVAGTGDKLVSGRAKPMTFRFGRVLRGCFGPDVPPVDFSALLRMALRAEARFGAPQDIEWAYAAGQFWILQSRDITATDSAHDDPQRAEWRRLAALAGDGATGGANLAQNEMSEMLPRPTALSLSLLEKIWASGGGVDHALRSLGLDARIPEHAPSIYVTAFGRLYCDVRQAAARAPRLNGLALRRIRRQAGAIARAFRDGFAPEFSKDMQLLEAVDASRLTFTGLSDLLRDVSQRFVTRTHADVDVINIAAQIYLDDARRGLEAVGHDPVTFLADFPRTAVAEALHAALSAPVAHQAQLVRAAIGHRARCDYDLAEPRYGEDQAALVRAAAALAESDAARAATLDPDVLARLEPDLAAKVDRARTFQTLKEDAKHLSLRELAQIRRLGLGLGDQSGLGALVFHLTLDEAVALSPENAAEMKRTAGQRRDTYRAIIAAPALGTTLTLDDLERGPLPRDAARVTGGLKGTRVSGSGVAEGRAVVVSRAACETGDAIAGFNHGDILVAPMIHPAWLAEVVRAGGVVTEIGGWLSHMSIVAREHGIVKIVGVDGLAAIAHGGRVRLHPDGRVECVETEDAMPEVLAAE